MQASLFLAQCNDARRQRPVVVGAGLRTARKSRRAENVRNGLASDGDSVTT
jgi:hypothetical protein